MLRYCCILFVFICRWKNIHTVRQCWSCTITEHIAALHILLVACAALRGANNMSGESGSDILLSIRPRRVPQAWNGAPGFDHFSPPCLVMYSQAQSTTYHFPLFTLTKLQILCTLYINTSLQLHRRAVLTEEALTAVQVTTLLIAFESWSLYIQRLVATNSKLDQ